MNKILGILLLIFTSISIADAQNYQKQAKSLDKVITEGIDLWQPPGLAVAIVKDGTPVFVKGYGVTNIGTSNPVDQNTLFVCASTTKAFTAAAIAILVDEGKLDWDDKVIDYLPHFKLKDPYLTRELTVRDLLTHRSGLGNTDYLWSMMTISGDSAITRLVDSDLSYSPRSSFIYQNLMYLAAGQVVEAISGLSWAEYLQKNIYKPLGMTNTYPFLSDVSTIENKAAAHYDVNGEIIKVAQLSADAIGPAGSMWSSITDMAKWMSFLSNGGIINEDTLISTKSFNELFNPQQVIPSSQFYPSQKLTNPNWMTYGLGWFQHDYSGRKVDFHTGSLPGMVAIAGLIREENLGVYVFGNLDHVELRHAIMYSAFDIYTNGKLSRNWSQDLKELYDTNNQEEEELVKIENAPSSYPSDSLLGTYNNKMYGNIFISEMDGNLRFDLNGTIMGNMEHWHYDTYKVTFDIVWNGDGMIDFRKNSDATIGYVDFWGIRFDRKK